MADNNAKKLIIDGGTLYTERIEEYLNEKMIGELFANQAQFSGFTKTLKMGKSKNPDFKIFQYNNQYWNPVLTPAPTMAITFGSGAFGTIQIATATTLTSGASGGRAYLQAGTLIDVYDSSDTYVAQLVMVKDAVSVVNSGGTVTTTLAAENPSTYIKAIWVESASRSQTVTMAAGSKWCVVGHAMGENSLSPKPSSDEMDTGWNSCGIFRTPLAISGTLLEAALRGETSELAWERKKKLRDHVIKKDKALLFSRRIGGIMSGVPASSTWAYSGNCMTDSDNNQIRTTHGLIPSIKDYYSTVGSPGYLGDGVISMSMGSYGWEDFKSDARKIFKFSNDNAVKYMFCGDGFLSFMNSLVGGPMGSLAGRVNVTVDSEGQERFGFNIRAFETPFGILKLVRSPLMTLTDNGRWANSWVVVDPEFIGHVSYRTSSYKTAIQENDRDGIKDEYFSDEGLWIGQMQNHFFGYLAA